MRLLLGGLVWGLVTGLTSGYGRAAPPSATRPLELPAHIDADLAGRVDTTVRDVDSFFGTTTGALVELGLGARLRVPHVDAQLDLAIPFVSGSSYEGIGGAYVGVPALGVGAWLCAGRLADDPVRIFVGLRTTVDTTPRDSTRGYGGTELLRRMATYDMAYRPGEVFSADSSIRLTVSARWAGRATALQAAGIVGTSSRLNEGESYDGPRSFFGGQVGGAVTARGIIVIGEAFGTCAGNPCYASVHLGLRLARVPALTLHASHFEGREDYEPGSAVGLRVVAGL